ncbi:MAG TPA: hypothetical protein VFI70_02165 [Nitrososphaeraceae archaeon]|nr:hypothetical protein [Nitrososphaeraceae archaeon]
MTFKDLKKRVSFTEQQEQQSSLALLTNRLMNKPFWIWDIGEHKQEDVATKGDCCFNHIIGLPTKDGVEKPMFDYQKLLYDSSLIPEACNPLNHDFKHRHLWVKLKGISKIRVLGSVSRQVSENANCPVMLVH